MDTFERQYILIQEKLNTYDEPNSILNTKNIMLSWNYSNINDYTKAFQGLLGNEICNCIFKMVMYTIDWR